MTPGQYRKRAELAIGRKLHRHEHVHHHSETQLVICDRQYHRWLHSVMRKRGIDPPKLSFRSGIVSFRIPKALMRRLRVVAEREDRAVANVIRRAIREGVDRDKKGNGK